MRIVENDEEKKITSDFMDACREEALKSTCKRSRCGSVIVRDEEIIGRGYNSSPNEDPAQERCHIEKDSYNKKVTDKTCCIHAEQRAVMDALRNNGDKIKDSTIYFIRIDDNGDAKFSGEPYCTICSKFVLDAGVSYFVLNKAEGFSVYDTKEYNDLSFNYKE